MIQKYIIKSSQIFALYPVVLAALPGTVFAASTDQAVACKTASFFGLIPWYKYLQLDSKCNITSFVFLPETGQHSDIPLVLLAVIDDLLRIAGIVAVGYIIYGGIRYIISQGNPEATGKARQTILNSLIGLVIALIAVSAVSYIGSQLGSK